MFAMATCRDDDFPIIGVSGSSEDGRLFLPEFLLTLIQCLWSIDPSIVSTIIWGVTCRECRLYSVLRESSLAWLQKRSILQSIVFLCMNCRLLNLNEWFRLLWDWQFRRWWLPWIPVSRNLPSRDRMIRVLYGRQWIKRRPFSCSLFLSTLMMQTT